MTPLGLPLVEAADLPDRVRDVLRPVESHRDADGHDHPLPTRFLHVDTWETALNTAITPHFMLWELLSVDVREAAVQRAFPRYVPCAVILLAQALELFRLEVGTYVHIAANGGYRSPRHALTREGSRHSWGTAANIFRIGDQYLDDRETLEKFAAIARRTIPGAWIRPYGPGEGQADDHLHIDLGYTIYEPVRTGTSKQ